MPSAGRTDKGVLFATLPSFLVGSAELLDSLQTSLTHDSEMHPRPSSLLIDVSSNNGGYIVAMLSVMQFLLSLFPVNSVEVTAAKLCPLLVFPTMLSRQKAAKLMGLLRDFPKEVCKQCLGPILTTIEAYAREAGLPDAVIQSIMRKKASLFLGTWQSEPKLNALTIRTLLLQVLTSQSKHFLSLTGMEEQHCLRELDRVLVSSSRAASRLDNLLHQHQSRVCVGAMKSCEDMFSSQDSANYSIPGPPLKTFSEVKQVVIVSNGWCVSTCAQFVYMLRHIHRIVRGFPRVKVVTYGGVNGVPLPVAYAGHAIAYVSAI